MTRILDVFALTVRLSPIVAVNEVQLNTLAHSVNTRVFTFEDERAPQVTVCPLVLSVHFVKVIPEVPLSKAS